MSDSMGNSHTPLPILHSPAEQVHDVTTRGTEHDELIDTLRRRLAAVRDLHHEEPRHGLEALADRNPKLRARVDALRAALPKDPPMREPEPLEDEGETA